MTQSRGMRGRRGRGRGRAAQDKIQKPGTEQRVGAITENGAGVRAAAGGRPVAPTHAFDAMNNLVAHMLANLTASVRFDGARNTRASLPLARALTLSLPPGRTRTRTLTPP